MLRTGTSFGDGLRGLLPRQTPKPITINVENEREYYRNGDAVTGTVDVCFDHGLAMDDLEITLEGIVYTSETFENLTAASSLIGVHGIAQRVLRMEYPLPNSPFVGGQAKAGEHYQIPFHFVFPYQLLENVCACGNPQHLRLPASMGKSAWKREDMCPETVSIQYFVQAKAVKVYHFGSRSVLSQSKHVLKFIPEYEDAPINQLEMDCSIRKGLLHRKSGKVRVEALVPSLNSNGVIVPLRLLSNAKHPPRLTNLTVKLRCHTIWSLIPMPQRPTTAVARYPAMGKYRTEKTLSSHAINVDFYNGEANLAAIVLPNADSTFMALPTLETCRVYRYYVLVIELGSAGGRFKIKLPIDVTSTNTPLTPLHATSALPLIQAIQSFGQGADLKEMTVCAMESQEVPPGVIYR